MRGSLPVTDRETLAVYDARAAEYAKLVDPGDAPDTQLQAFLNDLPAGGAILDLGCGPGRSAGLMAAAGYKVTATDASAQMIALARAQPGVTARLESFDDLTGAALYDGVWANFSLLHARHEDLPRYLAAIATALKPKGLFHIGLKTGSGISRDGLGRRYAYLDHGELSELLQSAGLTEFRHWTGEGPGLSGSIDPWLVVQARKNA